MIQEPDPAVDAGVAQERGAELSEFLRGRRARLKPSDVGLVDHSRYRRVPGLRREELAQLAGVSMAYYTRLEQGHVHNASLEILDAIARVLQLSEAESLHLTHLAGPKRPFRKRPATRPRRVRSSLCHLLDSMTGVPACVIGSRADILAWNGMAAALFGDWSQLPARERNWARLIFLDPGYRDLFVDWEHKASEVVSYLWMDAGRHPGDLQLSALVGELSVKSEEFRRIWARHEVQNKGFGVKRMHHPLVGEITLSFESFRAARDSGQVLITFHAEPHTPSAEAMHMLASWGADATAAGAVEHSD
ncbi:MmyB family transcriptional regulator [Streptomyces sp. MA5143a]|uniref:MmyB family transcriptional regulator n=1 Tax=Streptomyces sp. MA5143a TaxID=2083010 RepID=UPI000D1B4670|nr:helix-turn-helix domain-containing protein [Streptomyces sp. MA5143a]